MPLSDNTVSITLSEPKSTSEKSDYRENTNLSFLPSRIYNFQPLESKVQKHTSPVNLHNRILSASNFLKLSAGTLFYPSIQFKNTIAPNMDISPYLQIAYVHSLNHSRHWSFNTGMGLNMLRIRGADSLIYNDTYFSFGTITFDSLQNINSSITLPPQGKRVSQEQLIQLHIPFFIIYNLNQKHSFQLGGTVFYLLNVSSKINANQTTPTASLFSNSDMEEVQTREWGYTSGIRTWQMSAGVQYEYHMSKHFSLQAGAQKMMRDLSDNSFYGNKRNTLPWLFNVGVQYRIKTKF
jgi:hypothetical protein